MKNRLLFYIFLLSLPAASAQADPFDVESKVKTVPQAEICSLNIKKEKLHLADVVNLALCRNPQTRKLYTGAMAAAAEYGQTKAGYLPEVNFNAGINQSDTTVIKGRDSNSAAVSAGLSLNWLLYDFGGREASNESVLQSLNTVLATRSDALQGLVFDAAEAYFKVFEAQEEYKNSDATLAAALSVFEAASKRYELGLAAKSDKLQAETSYAEAQLSVTKAAQALSLARGKLAVLLDVSPDQQLDLYEEPFSANYLTVSNDIESLFKMALSNRSDIAAKKAAIKQAEASLDVQKARNAPSLNLSAGLDGRKNLTGDETRSYTSSVGLTLTVPLFTGFKNTYRVSQSRYQLEQIKAELKQLENDVRHEVWTAYHNFGTAKKSYEISLTMLVSAEQNAQVALGAYKAGKGSILNVLDAQAKLASARSTKSRSFYEVLIAKTNIIRKVGLIDPFQTNKGF